MPEGIHIVVNGSGKSRHARTAQRSFLEAPSWMPAQPAGTHLAPLATVALRRGLASGHIGTGHDDRHLIEQALQRQAAILGSCQGMVG